MKLIRNLLLFTFISILNKSVAQKNSDEQLTLLKQEIILQFLNLNPTDKVADIGTGSGFSLVPIAGSNPNLIFTVEDIDSTTLNRKKLLA